MKNVTASVLLVLAATACSSVGGTASLDDEGAASTPVAGTGDSCLGAGAIEDNQKAATHGQVAAMKRLYLHYAICTDDRAAMLHWMERAAMSGSSELRKALVLELQRSRDPDEAKKASRLAKDWGLDSLVRP